MFATRSLRTFRPTARMMRPIPVSRRFPCASFDRLRQDANPACVEGGAGWYVKPLGNGNTIDDFQCVGVGRIWRLTGTSRFTAHTVSQRLRHQAKQVPAELWPLGEPPRRRPLPFYCHCTHLKHSCRRWLRRRGCRLLAHPPLVYRQDHPSQEAKPRRRCPRRRSPRRGPQIRKGNCVLIVGGGGRLPVL
jgi:hypothetical protein